MREFAKVMGALLAEDADRVRLLARKNKEFTRDFPSVAAAVGRIRCTAAPVRPHEA